MTSDPNLVTLPSDFKIDKYGIMCRLVNENDVDFIFSLRSDKHLTRFIHQIDDDIEKQRIWIKEYKKREADGTEFYFIYSHDGKPFALNRIYNISNGTCTSGSWLSLPGTPMELSIPTALINRDIMFGILNLKEDNFDVRKGNLKVQKFHAMTGSVKTGETELDILYKATPETHEIGKNRIIKLLGINKY